MNTPAQRLGWAGVFVLAGVLSVAAEGTCQLSPTAVCDKFEPGLRFSCVKHVQSVVAICRKAARKERFGSHQDHCRAVCRSGRQAYTLDKRLREFAMTTVANSALGNAAWQRDAVAFWQAAGPPQSACSSEQFERALADCEQHCSVKAKRRDLEELQALAAGKDFLDLQLPVFACPPGPATRLLSREDASVLERLYAPGHHRRSGAAAE